MPETPPLRGRVAIVTGGGAGIGAAAALALAQAGADIAVNDINPDRAERVAQAVRAAGAQAVALTADISNKFKAAHVVEQTRDRFGRLDLLINAAVVRPRIPLLRVDEWDWNRCLEVNLKGAFLMTQLVGRVLQAENSDRGGAIVILGRHVDPSVDHVAFAASQSGLWGLAAGAAAELEPHGIAVPLLEVGTAPDVATDAERIAHVCIRALAHPDAVSHGQRL